MTYSVKQIAERYGVGEHTVLKWIGAGELAAVNVGRQMGRRPKWRISAEALQTFELLRSATPREPVPGRRQKRSAGLIEFY